jgi:hypothetical protein
MSAFSFSFVSSKFQNFEICFALSGQRENHFLLQFIQQFTVNMFGHDGVVRVLEALNGVMKAGALFGSEGIRIFLGCFVCMALTLWIALPIVIEEQVSRLKAKEVCSVAPEVIPVGTEVIPVGTVVQSLVAGDQEGWAVLDGRMFPINPAERIRFEKLILKLHAGGLDATRLPDCRGRSLVMTADGGRVLKNVGRKSYTLLEGSFVLFFFDLIL